MPVARLFWPTIAWQVLWLTAYVVCLYRIPADYSLSRPAAIAAATIGIGNLLLPLALHAAVRRFFPPAS